MAASDILSLLLGPSANSVPLQLANDNQETMVQMFDSFAPFSLGTNSTVENRKRTRKEIYTKWEQMLRFAPVAEGIGIHVTAALGGDTHNGQQIFITPAERLRGESGAMHIMSSLISWIIHGRLNSPAANPLQSQKKIQISKRK